MKNTNIVKDHYRRSSVCAGDYVCLFDGWIGDIHAGGIGKVKGHMTEQEETEGTGTMCFVVFKLSPLFICCLNL